MGNDRVRKIGGGILSEYAGTGGIGYTGESLPALNTNFDDPVALSVDLSDVYVLDDEQKSCEQLWISEGTAA